VRANVSARRPLQGRPRRTWKKKKKMSQSLLNQNAKSNIAGIIRGGGGRSLEGGKGRHERNPSTHPNRRAEGGNWFRMREKREKQEAGWGAKEKGSKWPQMFKKKTSREKRVGGSTPKKG